MTPADRALEVLDAVANVWATLDAFTEFLRCIHGSGKHRESEDSAYFFHGCTTIGAQEWSLDDLRDWLEGYREGAYKRCPRCWYAGPIGCECDAIPAP